MTSELSLTGYPPQDLLLRTDFIKKTELYKRKLISITKNKKTIFVLNIPNNEKGKLYNSLFLFKNGSVVFKKNKSILPNYGVFDEKRYFETDGMDSVFFVYKKYKIKFLICEEMWSDEYMSYNKRNFDFVISLNASPFELKKFDIRKKMAKKNVKNYNANLIYLNLVGGQDDLIFDGGSFIMNQKGEIVFQTKFFSDSEYIISDNEVISLKPIKRKYDEVENLYKALVYSLKNYMSKNTFKKAILGLSGGIDSALCLMIASDALGSKNINSFFLPSKYTSFESKKDAYELAKNLEVDIKEISIELLRKNVSNELDFLFKGLPSNITEENIQSRIRGLFLMAISNKFNSLLITTGNKSELAVGYSTLYGDMCGGFSLIKDVYKSQVIKLTNWRNKNLGDNFKIRKINNVPINIINKEPSAELKPNQKDSDSLPNYDTLDKILELMIDKRSDLSSIKKSGFSEKIIKEVWKMVKNSEYKRYQSSIGPKVSEMSFDKDRRFPLTNKFNI